MSQNPMIQGYKIYKDLLEKGKIVIQNHLFNSTVNKINVFLINNELDISEEIKIKLKKSLFIIVDEKRQYLNDYLIICFDQQLMIFEKSNQTFIEKLFKHDISEEKFFFLSKSRQNFIKIFKNCNKNDTSILQGEIENFVEGFLLSSRDKILNKFWLLIVNCLSGYLIKKSYINADVDRVSDFLTNIENFVCIENDKIFIKKEFVFLRNISNGSFAYVNLYYNIEFEKLFALKEQPIRNSKYIKREINHYKHLIHPLISRFYGIMKDEGKEYIVLEYIHGSSLDSNEEFNIMQKYLLILQMLYIFKYLHKYNYIYQDLKPNNVILDENDKVVLIDFGSMINENDKNLDYSKEFNLYFSAPELSLDSSIPSNKCDIYSIGQMIYFVFNESIKKNPDIYAIYKKCTLQNPNDRVDILDLIQIFKEYILKNQNIFKEQNFSEKDCKKIKNEIEKKIFQLERISTIFDDYSFDKNSSTFIFNVGKYYYEGKYIVKNFNKAIKFLSMAADLNNVDALNYLGIIYLKKDINLAIHYFTVAASLNDPKAQTNLGCLYSDGMYINKDINKAIYYLSLASDQNNSNAQNNLGLIYQEKELIDKAIHYFQLSANANNFMAYYNIGMLYLKGKYIKQDIKKAIYYFELSANLNNIPAQNVLGTIYYDGKYINRDINKAIYYLKLSAEQNCAKALYSMGRLYLEGKYIDRDLKKSIYYFEQASNTNDVDTLFNLGLVYFRSPYLNSNINKAITYFTQAANQNDPQAQYYLGMFFFGK